MDLFTQSNEQHMQLRAHQLLLTTAFLHWLCLAFFLCHALALMFTHFFLFIANSLFVRKE